MQHESPAARSADSDALAALLHSHTAALVAHLRTQMPQRWQALLAIEDVLQETFTDAFLSIRSFVPRGDGALLVWLKKLAQNNLLEAIRALEAEKRGGGRRPMSIEGVCDAHTTLMQELLPVATQTTPSQHAMRQETRTTVESALAELPAHYRLAIQRYDLEGRSIDETAAELGCSPGGAHLVRHRALQRLRAMLTTRSQISRGGA
jgi:RNA polymerase sigma factor (sigma-70 family)